jgi:hypothetical protein
MEGPAHGGPRFPCHSEARQPQAAVAASDGAHVEPRPSLRGFICAWVLDSMGRATAWFRCTEDSAASIWSVQRLSGVLSAVIVERRRSRLLMFTSIPTCRSMRYVTRGREFYLSSIDLGLVAWTAARDFRSRSCRSWGPSRRPSIRGGRPGASRTCACHRLPRRRSHRPPTRWVHPPG